MATLDDVILKIMSHTRKVPSVELHTEFSKEAQEQRATTSGWNEALALATNILRTSKIDGGARCTQAENKLNWALKDNAKVFYTLEEAVDTACDIIKKFKALPSKDGAPGQGLPYGIIDPDYARVYTIIRNLAWQEGYAIGLHGSFTRDLDLIAVPWTDTACEAEHLVARILDATDLKSQHSNPGIKPHGRRVWTLLFPGFSDPRWVDLSIVPFTKAQDGIPT